MMSERSTRLPRRVFAVSSALALVALVFSGGGQAAAGLQKSSGPRPTASDLTAGDARIVAPGDQPTPGLR
jgi:hypothetical protein